MTISDESIRNANASRHMGTVVERQCPAGDGFIAKQLAATPLRPGKGSDTLPVISKEALWLFVQRAGRKSRMEQPVPSVPGRRAARWPFQPARDLPIT